MGYLYSTPDEGFCPVSVQLTSADLGRFVEENGITARLIAELGDTPTVPAAAAALGVSPDAIVKTLLFLVNDPAQKETPPQPVVVISNGERRVEKKGLAGHFGVGKNQVKLAPPDVVLDELGYPAGGVPPFGHRRRLPVFVDASIRAFADDEVIYGGGGDDRTMLALTVAELIRVTAPVAVIALS
jgi:prolyl-tRNA editing enzyme YbaK/EbsC (Cys-tRNA(Pro) deacylase)